MVRDDDVREFLAGLSEKRPRQQLKMYGQTSGMADRAELAQAELDRRSA